MIIHKKIVYRYEYWENNILEKCIQTCKLPMWNAIFCGVSLKYTNKGICSSLYKRALQIMTSHYNKSGSRRRSCHVDYGNLLRLKFRKMSLEKCEKSSETVPLVVAVSHSVRSSRFHTKNGFCPMEAIPYKINGQVQFNVHILAHEPFNCGKSKVFAASFNSCVASNNSKNEIIDDSSHQIFKFF